MTIVMAGLEKMWLVQRAHSGESKYNRRMSEREWSMNLRKQLRVVLLLWIGYFLALAAVDWWLVDRHPNVLIYYAVHIGNGLFILSLTFPQNRFWSEERMIPVALVLMAILPSLTVHLLLRLAPNELLLSPEGMTLRLTPILLLGLLLTAWQYQWRHVILFALGTLAANMAGVLPWPAFMHIFQNMIGSGADLAVPQRPPPGRPLPMGGILVTIIQLISLLIVGYITSTLISRLRQQRDALSEANAQLRNQANTQIELTITRERNRMARELHDTLAHTLSGLTVQLQTVRAYWEIEPETAQEMVDDALDATRRGLQETRSALKALRAAPLEDLGLALAIRQQAETAAERANLALQLLIPEPLPSYEAEVSHCLYRVAQEAITNVVYHANAKTLSVTLNSNGHGTQLTVADDGIGFDPEMKQTNHWGIKGLHERAQLVGGHLLIDSEAERGTTVQLIIPKKHL